jgi:cysteine desulfurase/selenocysteine lyase
MGDANTVSTENPCIDVDKIRADFPVLSKEIGGKPLIYLDNGATTQKPWQVINRVSQFDSEEY